ncbi:universal stress protein [Hufsiella ginkgonis]|uniref:Universal stress protein n=1 Tax=Hufsiella ginkgonis TaxID=2695274 RepID=A0A7K1Y0V9_9SPHI|nr:universal stress protein [Hufsiella ginkgonis]MXV16737.1 universal stress protein [Hufsiella ginkgonis]
MKTLLVLIDFSAASVNAARYAVSLAGQLPACRVILYHPFVFEPLCEDEEFPVTLQVEDFYEESIGRLLELRCSLKPLLAEGRVIDCRTGQSPLADALPAIARQEQVDLVIAGGRGGEVSDRRVTGTAMADSLLDLPFPLLVVPPGCTYKPVSHAVFACELKGAEKIPVDQVRAAMESFRSKLHLLHVENVPPQADTGRNLLQQQLRLALKDLDPEFHFVYHRNVQDGILQFIDTEHTGLLIMIRKKHGFFYNLVQGSVTRKLSMHLSAPLLVLREKEPVPEVRVDAAVLPGLC